MSPEKPRMPDFEILSERYAVELRLHKHPGGLWKKDTEGKDWRNVTEHCLLEAARAEVFARKLMFAEDIARDLSRAAALHDFYKKIDIQYTREDIAKGGNGDAGSLRSEAEGVEHLRRAGYDERITRFVGGVGADPTKLLSIAKILSSPEISDEDFAMLVLHYIDDYTAGAASAGMASNGKNDVDARTSRNAANPDYQKMNEAAKEVYAGTLFEGMTRFEAQAEVAHHIEKNIAEEIGERSGEHIDPLRLPEIIDAEL